MDQSFIYTTFQTTIFRYKKVSTIARLPKCPECERQVDKDTQRWVKHSSKTYHEVCFQQFQTRKQDREELLAYICELYQIPVPNGFMLKQIKDFQETYGYKIKGIQMALHYFHEIKGHPIDGQGIGIIPYIYDEAKRYYIELSNIKKKAAESPLITSTETVYLKPTPKKKKNYIDIEGI